MTVTVVLISDTHLHHDFDVPDGDILIHAGDGTLVGSEDEVIAWADWMGSLPHEHKIAIAGNHDWLFTSAPKYGAMIMDQCGVTYLQEKSVTVDGLNIYGAPWIPSARGWAFAGLGYAILKAHWDKVPANTNILVTHGPPRGVLDLAEGNELLGDPALFDRANALGKGDLLLHVFGHVHEQGCKRINAHGHISVNAAVCNDKYRPVNKPLVVTI